MFVAAWEISTNVANPINKDDINGDAEEIQLTNMQASEAPRRWRGASLASIFVSWICKAQLITASDKKLHILRGWKEIHLRKVVTNATPPASKDGVFNCSEQLQLTVDSGAPSRLARSSTVHC